MAKTIQTRMNLETAVTDEMIAIALEVKPEYVCLVPEKREELTTEGGLDVAGNIDKIAAATKTLTQAGIKVSLFIDADKAQLDAAKACGAPYVEIHTGAYADAGKPGSDDLSVTRFATNGHLERPTATATHGLPRPANSWVDLGRDTGQWCASEGDARLGRLEHVEELPWSAISRLTSWRR